MNKDRYAGQYRLGLNSVYVPNTSHFQTLYMSFHTNLTKVVLLELIIISERQINRRASTFEKNFGTNS